MSRAGWCVVAGAVFRMACLRERGQGLCSAKDMTDGYLQRIRASFQQRKEVIDELHFVYKRLLRLLPNIARRSVGKLAEVLRAQHAVDRAVHSNLVDTAVQHGHVPGPCVCEEASKHTGQLYHVASTTPRTVRPGAVVEALASLRAFLIRSWGRLLGTLPEDILPELRRSATELQRKEADQHRQVVALGQRLEGDGDDGPVKRTG